MPRAHILSRRGCRRLGTPLFLLACAALQGCEEPLGFEQGPVQVLWEHRDRGGATGVPYADEEIAVFSTLIGSRIVALGAGDGKKRWDTHVELPPEFRRGLTAGLLPGRGRLLGTGDLIVVPAWDLYALDRTTGQVRWKLAPPDDFPGAEVTLGSDGDVYSVGRHLYRVHSATGAVRWRADLGEQPFAPVEKDGVVYVGTRGTIPGTGNILGAGHAVAVDAQTGAVLWKTPIPAPEEPANGGIVGAGTLTPELFIVSSPNGRIYALERSTGQIRWETRGSAGYYNSGVVVLGSVAVTATGTSTRSPTGRPTGYVEAFDLATGQPRWKVDVGGEVPEPLGTDGRAVFAVKGQVWAISAEGQVLWRHHVPREAVPYSTGPRIHGETLYLGAIPGGSASGVGEGFYALRIPR